MMMMARYDNHHRSFTSYGDIDGDGPTTGNNNNRPKSNKNNHNSRNIYDVLSSSDDSGSGVVVGSGGSVGVRFLQQQPFDISSTSTSTAHQTAFKSPGGIMAASLEFPFTFSQYKELERQVMIFKYMKASVPVPIDLLMPGIPSFAMTGGGGGLNLRFSGGRGDFEPGRCKRTDGKKWRCSRDVAPDQKYCERHLHRGRPRSRKPVELPNNKKSRHGQSQTQALPSSSSSSAVLPKKASQPQLFGTLTQPVEKAATFWPLPSVSRTSDWTMNEELITLADQQWHNLMQLETASTGTSFSNYDKEPLNLISCPNFNSSVDEQRNGPPWFLNSEFVPLGKSPESAPRGFIDAWSTGVSDEASVSCNGELPVSSLSLSMGIKNIEDEEMGLIRMGLGVNDYDHQSHEFASKSDLSSWLSSPASWAGSTPGGPLAEVLRPSVAVSSSNPSSPVTGNGNSCSPAVTAVSSPSGVLQKALVSFSDSSGSSSPTFLSSRAKPEIGLMLG